MNYRRGFQRVYTALTVVWILSTLLIIPSERLKFWSSPAKLRLAVPEVLKDPDFQALPEDEQSKVLLMMKTRVEKTLWLAGILLTPPALGYGLLFVVMPWIYRGFKTETHT